MKPVVSQAIVLSRTNFQEADRIVTVLTPDHGKLRLIAKGSRKVRSKLAGSIELFSLSDITFLKGKGEIGTLISGRLKHHNSRISADINRTMLGYEILKRLNKATEDSTGPEYFELLKQTLGGLDQLNLSPEALELWFNCQLLKLAGHTPNLKTDTLKRTLSEGQGYQFDLDKMSFRSTQPGDYNANDIKLLRLAFSLDSPLKLGQVNDLHLALGNCLPLSKLMVQQFIH